MGRYSQLIDRALGVTTSARGAEVEADARELPGSPPVGTGRNADAARYELVCALLVDAAMSNPGKGYADIIAVKIRKAVQG